MLRRGLTYDFPHVTSSVISAQHPQTHPKNNTSVYLNHPPTVLGCLLCVHNAWVLKEKKAQAFTHAEKSIVSEAGKRSQPWVNAALHFSCSVTQTLCDSFKILSLLSSFPASFATRAPRRLCHFSGEHESAQPAVTLLQRAFSRSVLSSHLYGDCAGVRGSVTGWVPWTEALAD